MSWLSENWWRVGELLQAHLFITLPATALIVSVSVPIGRFAHRFPKVGGVTLSGVMLTCTIPSLPLLVVVPFVIRTPLRSPLTIITALGLYGTALPMRTTSDVSSSMNQTVIDGATAVGYSRGTLPWAVKLPLAVSILVSGIKIVAVFTMGLVAIGVFVGIPSVGTFLIDGFQQGITAEVVTGVVVTVALAFVVNGLVVPLDRPPMPWTKAGKVPDAKGEQA